MKHSSHTQYKAVFCDIDGTLLTTDHRITDRTKEKIQDIHRSGIPFILVSARMPAGIDPIQKELGIKAPIISYGGALILNEEGRPISSTGLSLSLAEKIRSHVPEETEDYRFCAYSGEKWIVSNRTNPVIRQEEKVTKVRAIEGQMRDFLSDSDIIHKLMCFGPSGLLDDISAGLRAQFPQCTIYKSFHTLLEIMDGHVTKSRAVHTLCGHLGISPQLSAAFGDNYNDADMLQAAGLGIAMGNAPEEVQKQASWVTADNDHEGLFLALDRLFP